MHTTPASLGAMTRWLVEDGVKAAAKNGAS